jgi:hypothetical protein
MNHYEKLLKRARRINAVRDAMDRSHGFAPPADCSWEVQVKTVISALQAGITHRNWDCVAEAQAMLEDMVRRAGQ